MKKKIIPFIAAIALIIVVVLFMVLGNIIEKYTPSKETKDLSEYYGLTSDTDVALICNNEVIDTKGKLVNGEVYLSYETVRNYLNARFYWDPNENILRYTTANDLISVNAERKVGGVAAVAQPVHTNDSHCSGVLCYILYHLLIGLQGTDIVSSQWLSTTDRIHCIAYGAGVFIIEHHLNTLQAGVRIYILPVFRLTSEDAAEIPYGQQRIRIVPVDD